VDYWHSDRFIFSIQNEVAALKILYNVIISVVLVALMVLGSRYTAHFFAVKANLNPLSKNVSLLTLLLMFFFFIGVILTTIIALIWEHFNKTNGAKV
jgi:flagellar biosynthesis protein FlhB